MNRHRVRVQHLQESLQQVLNYHAQEYDLTVCDIVGVLHILAYNELSTHDSEDDDDLEDCETAGF